jgi:hypothetical protein
MTTERIYWVHNPSKKIMIICESFKELLDVLKTAYDNKTYIDNEPFVERNYSARICRKARKSRYIEANITLKQVEQFEYDFKGTFEGLTDDKKTIHIPFKALYRDTNDDGYISTEAIDIASQFDFYDVIDQLFV